MNKGILLILGMNGYLICSTLSDVKVRLNIKTEFVVVKQFDGKENEFFSISSSNSNSSISDSSWMLSS